MTHKLVMKFTPALLFSVIGLSGAGFGDDTAGSNLDSFRKCAQIVDDSARLSCFDEAASVFDFAKAKARLEEAKNLKAETARLKAEAEMEAARVKIETQRLKDVAAREKAESDRLKAAAEREAAKMKAEAESERAQKEAVIAAEAQRQADLEALALEQFGQPGAVEGGFNEITSQIVATKQPQIGGIYIKLENDHIWQVSDKKSPGRLKPGMTVRIQETTLGGLFMSIEETGKSFRVKRVN